MKLPKIRMTKADAKAFFMLAGIQLLVYFIFSVNARALAQGRVVWTFTTDLVFAATNYSLIKYVADNKNRWGQLGYVVGGAWAPSSLSTSPNGSSGSSFGCRPG